MNDLFYFARSLGFSADIREPRRAIQQILSQVQGTRYSHAVNMVTLRSMKHAEYRPENLGHYALAADHYCHFTSPIRRYPDLVVHRALDLLASGRRPEPVEVEEGEVSPLDALAAEMSRKERGAEAAEQELKLVLVLHHLATKVGEEFEGVVTGVADFGLFVQVPRFLVEGVVKLADLGDDWWEVSAERGAVRGETTGRTIRIGDRLEAKIMEVDVPHRRLVLGVPQKKDAAGGKPAKVAKPAQRAKRDQTAKPARRADQSRREINRHR